MKLEDVQKHWDAFGKMDPLWAILTDPTKRHGGWDEAEFFKTGETEIAAVMQYITSLGINLACHYALDFGCGVGRLTQALCQHFDKCIGIDIAPSMIELANKYNRHGARCHYLLNAHNNLRLCASHSFDLIYSMIVLQHMEPQYGKNYIKEFLRVLAPGGLLIFQVPDRLLPLESRLSPGKTLQLRPLPESAFCATLSIMSPPSSLPLGSRTTLQVQVRNMSPVRWPALGAGDGRYHIVLGNHWRDQSGTVVVNDDGRASLPRDLESGESLELSLLVTTPRAPGSYMLEVDMVQEGVTWFQQKGSPTAGAQIVVTSNTKDPREVAKSLSVPVVKLPSTPQLEPQMEMYGIPQDEVIALIQDAGGSIVDVQQNAVAGEHWLSFAYSVTKAREK